MSTAASDFRAAIERRDLDGMVAALADDVVLHSPVSFKPFEGKEAVAALFEILLRVFEDFRYTDELPGEEVHALIFRARVGDREVEGLDLVRPGPGGRILDFTVMVRPLTGVVALAEAVGAQLAAAQDAPAS
jgi:SnoaL-like protein